MFRKYEKGKEQEDIGVLSKEDINVICTGSDLSLFDTKNTNVL